MPGARPPRGAGICPVPNLVGHQCASIAPEGQAEDCLVRAGPGGVDWASCSRRHLGTLVALEAKGPIRELVLMEADWGPLIIAVAAEGTSGMAFV